MIVLGIDPGLRGGLALVAGVRLTDTHLLDAIEIPVTGEGAKKRVHVARVMEFIRRHPPDHAVIERAQAMPEQGRSSGFSYGRAVGALEAIAEGLMIPLTVVEPSAWKKAHGLIGRGKEDSRQRAIRLFPGHRCFNRKMDHGVAEAALIAWLGLMRWRPPIVA